MNHKLFCDDNVKSIKIEIKIEKVKKILNILYYNILY